MSADLEKTAAELGALKDETEALREQLGRLKDSNGRLVTLMEDQRDRLKALIARVGDLHELPQAAARVRGQGATSADERGPTGDGSSPRWSVVTPVKKAA